jgi:hypothetical protein
MWQSLAPEAVTITRAPGAAVTVLLDLPSAERTVTESPPLPVLLVETWPLPAVTLDDMPPALELLERLPLPVVPARFSMLQLPLPPDEELVTPLPADVVTLDELCALAAPTARHKMAETMMDLRIMNSSGGFWLHLFCEGRRG